ncbi:MAG: hypothetical protein ABL958_00845 [Bdellovibrionia bacterium]
MRIILSIVALLFLAAPRAEAKRFFDRPVTIKLTYSNINTGTQTVIAAREVRLRYSTSENCLQFKNGQYTPAGANSVSYSIGESVVDLYLYGEGVAFWTSDVVPANLQSAWARILTAYKKGSGRDISMRVQRAQAGTFQMQLHDNVANESFHIQIAFGPETEI